MLMHPLPLALLLVSSTWAADWPQFRGPNGTGIASSAAPVEFGPQKNLLWRTALPPGASSPVLTEDRIFVTAYKGDKLLTIAFNRKDGEILWQREAPRPRREDFQKTHGPASCTPVTDGRNVYVFFGDFGLISYDAKGSERWRVPLGPFNNFNGHGSSPMLADGMLVLIVDQDTDSYLLAVDAATGKTRWKTPRPEVTRGYATPVVYRPKNGPAELIIPGSYQVGGYELATGKKLWWVRGFGWQAKSVPVIDGENIIVNVWETGGDTDTPPEIPSFKDMQAKYDSNKDGLLQQAEIPEGKNAHFFADIDLERDGHLDEREWEFYRARRTTQNATAAIRGGGRGDITSTHVVWRYRKSLPNTPSPLLYQGVLYLVKDGGIATTLDPKTGAVLKQARLEGAASRYWASPVAAGGHVYMSSENGKISVLKAAGEWQVVATNDIGEDIMATPAIADGRIYLRTNSSLFCFGL
jgi:outer membrane protein assembly factor BamB